MIRFCQKENSVRGQKYTAKGNVLFIECKKTNRLSKRKGKSLIKERKITQKSHGIQSQKIRKKRTCVIGK